MSAVSALRTCSVPHRVVLRRGDTFTHLGGGRASAAVRQHARVLSHDVETAWPGAVLCTGHLARLTELVATTPTVVAWLRHHVTPSSGVREDSRSSGKRPTAPLPLAAAAVDAADEEFEVLAYWGELYAEQRGTAGPHLGTAGRDSAGRPRVLRAGDLTPVDAVTRWLTVRLDEIAAWPSAPDFLADLGRVRGRHHLAYPLRDRPRRITAYACEKCDRRSVVLYPPSDGPVRREDGTVAHQHPILVQCSHPTCGHRVEEERWRWLITLLDNPRATA